MSARRVKILYCIDCLVRGGTELQLTGLIERLDCTRYEPYLLTIRPTDPLLVPKNCQYLSWHVPSILSIDGMRSLYGLVRWLRAEKIDIVQTFFQDSTLFAGLAAFMARVPARIACFRDMAFWSNRVQALSMRMAYGLMHGFISNAAIVRDHFARSFGVDAGRVRVIGNGVDIDSLRFVEHAGDVTDVGIVGNMTRQVKRTDLFVRAVGLLAPLYPRIRWHIIGEGQLRGELEALAQELGVLDRIVFAGRVADVPAYLERLQVGVICSDSEGLSNALIEYMFKGVAVVATHVGGNPELVEHNLTGLLIPPGDVQALADAVQRLVDAREFRIALAHSARAHVEANYSWRHCLTAHDDFYTALLRSGNRTLTHVAHVE